MTDSSKDTDTAQDASRQYQCPNCKRMFQTSVPEGMLSCPHCQQKILLGPMAKISQGLKNLLKTEQNHKSPLNQLSDNQRNMLATKIDCHSCGAAYTVYEVFQSCVACQEEQNHLIFKKNLELVGKQLELAQTITTELHDLLIENSLEDLVSNFDGFARRLSEKAKDKASKPDKVGFLSFQNLVKARKDVKQLFSFDLSTPLETDRWYSANDSFQKRHVLTHNLGIVDEAYLEKSKNKVAKIGERVSIDYKEVKDLINDVDVLALHVLTTLELSEINQNPS